MSGSVGGEISESLISSVCNRVTLKFVYNGWMPVAAAAIQNQILFIERTMERGILLLVSGTSVALQYPQRLRSAGKDSIS